jgi:hypothetical protein
MTSGLSGVADLGSFTEGLGYKNCGKKLSLTFGLLIEEGRVDADYYLLSLIYRE